MRQGKLNYWGYNTLAFFAAHAPYASAAAQAEGAAAVLREFKGMVRLLHEAGLEVILDVVYNHTAEEGRQGPTYSFRGIDNAAYYRHDAHGRYIDVTGCGNTLDFGREPAQRLVLDSLRYLAERGAGRRVPVRPRRHARPRRRTSSSRPSIRCCRRSSTDPVLQGVEDDRRAVGRRGRRLADRQLPAGLQRVERPLPRPHARLLARRPASRARRRTRASAASAASRPASPARRTRSRSSAGRSPSLNFITAHDGFTLADLTAYDDKHNLGNGEQNRDGTDNNNSFNHGVEGQTDDPAIRAARRRSIRNLLGTLLLSAGVPMLTAGDEFGRSQRGNNNAYCHDIALTWLRVGAAQRLAAPTCSRRHVSSSGCAPRTPRCGRCASAGSARPRRARRRWTGSTPRASTMTHRRLELARRAHAAVPRGVDARVRGVQPHPAHRARAASRRPTSSCPVHDGRHRVHAAVGFGRRGSRRGLGTEHAPGEQLTIHGPSMRLFRVDGSPA